MYIYIYIYGKLHALLKYTLDYPIMWYYVHISIGVSMAGDAEEGSMTLRVHAGSILSRSYIP